MLVLSRKRGESIIIGSDIEVTIVEIRGDKVKLGLVGPSDVPIHREEVFRRIQKEHACAAELQCS
ncbi:MAG TPA: carbon storage regulator CsrA [Pirellulales bacterium]|jgi:carbon storage regulator|nr:carbon storage regulator CsrA [Pirellulales bacterium]